MGEPPDPAPFSKTVHLDGRDVRIVSMERGDERDALDAGASDSFGFPDASTVATAGQTYWETLLSSDNAQGVIGVSAGGARILHAGREGYWVFDRATRQDRRVDTTFDGHPLTETIESSAISADGSTVAFLLWDKEKEQVELRIVKVDGSENYDYVLPNAGSQTWSSGWVEQCGWLTKHGQLHLSQDGEVAWFYTEPCYYDNILALDVSGPALHWVASDILEFVGGGVTANGKSFTTGGDWYVDANWNGKLDPGERRYADYWIYPVEFDDRPAVPDGVDIPVGRWAYQFCGDLPTGSRATADGVGSRVAIVTDKVGLDPDTIVYPAGKQLYWAGRGCRPRSLGAATGYDGLASVRMADDGRSIVQEAHASSTDYGHLRRTDIPTGTTTDYPGIYTGDYTRPLEQIVDPLHAVVARAISTPGRHLAMTQLTGSPRALKVAVVGDSYISGEGSYGYELGTDVAEGEQRNLCHRSVSSWAWDLGQRLAAFRLNGDHPQLRSFACSGATTVNVEHGQYRERSQTEALQAYDKDGRQVDVVFASMGGNDVGFSDIVQTCALTLCTDDFFRGSVLADVRPAAANVANTLMEVKEAAPRATVFLMGYPSLADPPNGDCFDLGLTFVQRRLLDGLGRGVGLGLEQGTGGFHIDKEEQKWLNDVFLPKLNHELGLAARDAGVHFVDPAGWFAGHAVCSSAPYGHGLAAGDDFPTWARIFGNESFHPNPLGYEAMASRVEAKFGDQFRSDNNPLRERQGLVGRSPDEIGFLTVDGELRAWGDLGRVQVQNLPDGTRVVLSQFGNPTRVGSATVGADGRATIPYRVPKGLYPGIHRLIVFNETTGDVVGATVIAVEPPAECIAPAGAPDRDDDLLLDRCDADLTDGPGADADGDGVLNKVDICPTRPDPTQPDLNGDGRGDACDPDKGFNPVADLKPAPTTQIPRPDPKVEGITGAAYTPPAGEIGFELSSAEVPVPGLSATCSVDGQPPTACESPVKFAGLPEGQHTLTVVPSSDTGVTGKAVTHKWVVDATAPTVTVFEPFSTTNRTATIRFNVFNPGLLASPVTTTCALDGGTAVPCESPVRYDDLAVGEHTISVTAVDAVDHRSPASVARWTVRPAAQQVVPPFVPVVTRLPTAPTQLIDGTGQTSSDAPKGSSLRPLHVQRLRVSPRRFAAARRGGAILDRRRGVGSQVSYETAVGATTTLQVERRSPRRNRVTIIGRFRHTDRSRRVSFVFSGRVGGRALRPGAYRLVVSTKLRGRAAGRSATATFTIVRARS